MCEFCGCAGVCVVCGPVVGEELAFRAADGDFVTVDGEAGILFRVDEDRGDRLLVRALVAGIQPTQCLSREFVHVWNGAGTDEMVRAHLAEMLNDVEEVVPQGWDFAG